jgi:hypothetical protein
MAIGFSDRIDFSSIVGWELYQVTIDKYHVMFWFQNGYALLNVADSFSFRSANGSVRYTYEIYGSQKMLAVDSILRAAIKETRIVSKDWLQLHFETGDVLSIRDNPGLRSWWFMTKFERILRSTSRIGM